ncbi:N-6 DNA methylase [Priestia aryabhattai]|uniref:N-6 DNA methylase n=1 Tax=Priestia aryabhattai TaxID=412384 RepID=UPI001CCDF6F8|nr:N-6 DNA methylase [Priestia aryabhattai]MBZ6485061.1 N-6 DNA methylase [Priestia aryabhattai]
MDINHINSNELNQIEGKIRHIFERCLNYTGAHAEQKDYLLTFVFFKFLGDSHGFDLSELNITEDEFYKLDSGPFKGDSLDFGGVLDKTLDSIAKGKYDVFIDVFKRLAYAAKKVFGDIEQGSKTFRMLIENFKHIKLDPQHISSILLGRIYRRLIEDFPVLNNKSEHFAPTPEGLSSLIAKLIEPKNGDKIHDPTSGSGSLLVRVGEEVKSGNFTLYAQEKNGYMCTLCKMNILINGMHNNMRNIECGDTLTNPLLVKNNKLMKFNVVIAHPPFFVKNWNEELDYKKNYGRFGNNFIPPASKADYAFISHIVSVMDDTDGRAAVIVPNGVLYRGGVEKDIRESLIKNNVIDAVIGLPANLIYGTTIPVTLLIFNKGRGKKENVLFIDARESFVNSRTKNELGEEHISIIVATYRDNCNVDKFAYVADKEEICNNDYNLYIPRYVDKFEEESIDIDQITFKREALEKEILENQLALDKCLLELKDLI